MILAVEVPFSAPAVAQEIVLPARSVGASTGPVPLLKGLKVYPKNPLRFDAIVSSNTKGVNTLIKYFLASLTVPEKDLWVNLSPFEKERIVPQAFGQSEMGRDLLAQDYLLKQVAAGLTHPDSSTGKAFWKKVYEQAQARGIKQIPMNSFNKVWIVPDKAVVYENAEAGTVYIVEASLKVMMEQDYLALSKSKSKPSSAEIGTDAIRDIILPALHTQVNEGEDFALLRQVYHGLILAVWYKKRIRESVINQAYADHNKMAGTEYGTSLDRAGTAPSDVEFLYQRYLEAFKRGVYNLIKEEPDPIQGRTIPRKYFGGGLGFTGIADELAVTNDIKNVPVTNDPSHAVQVRLDEAMITRRGIFKATAAASGAMLVREAKSADERTERMFQQLFRKNPQLGSLDDYRQFNVFLKQRLPEAHAEVIVSNQDIFEAVFAAGRWGRNGELRTIEQQRQYLDRLEYLSGLKIDLFNGLLTALRQKHWPLVREFLVMQIEDAVYDPGVRAVISAIDTYYSSLPTPLEEKLKALAEDLVQVAAQPGWTYQQVAMLEDTAAAQEIRALTSREGRRELLRRDRRLDPIAAVLSMGDQDVRAYGFTGLLRIRQVMDAIRSQDIPFIVLETDPNKLVDGKDVVTELLERTPKVVVEQRKYALSRQEDMSAVRFYLAVNAYLARFFVSAAPEGFYTADTHRRRILHIISRNGWDFSIGEHLPVHVNILAETVKDKFPLIERILLHDSPLVRFDGGSGTYADLARRVIQQDNSSQILLSNTISNEEKSFRIMRLSLAALSLSAERFPFNEEDRLRRGLLNYPQMIMDMLFENHYAQDVIAYRYSSFPVRLLEGRDEESVRSFLAAATGYMAAHRIWDSGNIPLQFINFLALVSGMEHAERAGVPLQGSMVRNFFSRYASLNIETIQSILGSQTPWADLAESMLKVYHEPYFDDDTDETSFKMIGVAFMLFIQKSREGLGGRRSKDVREMSDIAKEYYSGPGKEFIEERRWSSLMQGVLNYYTGLPDNAMISSPTRRAVLVGSLAALTGVKNDPDMDSLGNEVFGSNWETWIRHSVFQNAYAHAFRNARGNQDKLSHLRARMRMLSHFDSIDVNNGLIFINRSNGARNAVFNFLTKNDPLYNQALALYWNWANIDYFPLGFRAAGVLVSLFEFEQEVMPLLREKSITWLNNVLRRTEDVKYFVGRDFILGGPHSMYVGARIGHLIRLADLLNEMVSSGYEYLLDPGGFQGKHAEEAINLLNQDIPVFEGNDEEQARQLTRILIPRYLAVLSVLSSVADIDARRYNELQFMILMLAYVSPNFYTFSSAFTMGLAYVKEFNKTDLAVFMAHELGHNLTLALGGFTAGEFAADAHAYAFVQRAGFGHDIDRMREVMLRLKHGEESSHVRARRMMDIIVKIAVQLRVDEPMDWVALAKVVEEVYAHNTVRIRQMIIEDHNGQDQLGLWFIAQVISIYLLRKHSVESANTINLSNVREAVEQYFPPPQRSASLVTKYIRKARDRIADVMGESSLMPLREVEMRLWDVLESLQIADSAMSSPGGIDMNPGNIALEVKAPEGSIRMAFDQSLLDKIQKIQGLSPVILGILPINDIRSFLIQP